MKNIRIVTGEGEVGTFAIYTGANTVRALRARLARERCGGDRWARAEVWEDGQLTQDDAEDVIARTAAAVALGKLGGNVKSKAKAEAARLNGARGGRPKKPKPAVYNIGVIS